MQENRLFEALLDVIPFSAYAVDVNTYEVVYANKLCSESMYAPREEYCWKKLYGQEEVCSWCKISELKQRQKVYKNEKIINDFFDESPSILDKLVIEHNPNAIGETGLDFFRNISSYDNQVYAFEEQIKIAIKHNKPLFLHQRDSHRDFINMLNKYKNYLPKCVVHCFTGSRDELNEYLNSGFYIGLTGWICDERRNQVLRETIKDIPLERLMIETDCPYLIPRNIKVKGNRNEPSFLPHIASEIASLMHVDEKVLIKQTYENAINFFN